MSVTFKPEGNSRYCRENDLERRNPKYGGFVERPYEMNVANGNAKIILNWLRLGYGGTVDRDPTSDLDALHNDTEGVDPVVALKRIAELPDPDILSIPDMVDMGRVTVHYCGVRPEQAARYIKTLREIATEAKRRGVRLVWD